jgi:hypothetical protein
MASEIENILGLPFQKERVIPGSLGAPGRQTIYFSGPQKGVAKQFKKLLMHPERRHAPRGGAILEGCMLVCPDSTSVHAVTFHGDVVGWRALIEEAAQSLGIVLATIRDNRVGLSDGRGCALSECRVVFD